MRTYYRCADCLEVAALDNNGETTAARCDCGGKLEFMGRVCVDRLVRDEVRCACDSRCTNATGPKCGCQCGGENHGTGRVVEIVVDVGAIPRVSARWDLADRIRRVEAYRDAVKSAEERIDRKTGGALSAIKASVRVENKGDWLAACNWQCGLKKAKGMRVHKSRMAALAKIAADTPRSENIGTAPEGWRELAAGVQSLAF